MKIALLLTGDELISGDILDTNSSMISKKLFAIGARINMIVTIGDHLQQISDTIKYLCNLNDIVIINGGLGPTQDDVTAEAVSTTITPQERTGAPSSELIRHPEAVKHLEAWCKARCIELGEQQLKQAWLPKGAAIFNNPVGSAVGFFNTYQNSLIIATPGVPVELEKMFEMEIVPFLKKRFNIVRVSNTEKLDFFGLGESAIQAYINEHKEKISPEVNIGFRTHFPMVELKLTTTLDQVDALNDFKDNILQKFGDYFISDQLSSLPATLIRLLQPLNKTLCTAESCTGGLVSQLICSEPGASSIFPGSLVSYSNDIKHRLLQVKESTLTNHGAVSSVAAREMALGALKNFSTDYCLALSGIAGPTGGSKEKPVGTLFIAWGTINQIKVKEFHLTYSRTEFQTMAAFIAMDLLRRDIQGIKTTPLYFQRFKPKD